MNLTDNFLQYSLTFLTFLTSADTMELLMSFNQYCVSKHNEVKQS